MTISIGLVGAGQFASQFAQLFQLHPCVDSVFVADVIGERAETLANQVGLTGTFDSADRMVLTPEGHPLLRIPVGTRVCPGFGCH